MTYCLNSKCPSPANPKNNNLCQGCNNPLKILRNRYRPIRRLGGGGFGQVYLAEDIDKLNQLCVIKKFESDVEGTAGLHKAIELFKREAQQLKELGEEHPQIPQLYAYFEEEGKLYLIQQYIEGETLEDELKTQGIFNEEKIISLLKELLNILKFVHERGIIHRDIKPPNIMRRSQPASTEQGSLVLIDLGIAKNINNSTSKSAIKSGTTVGSFGYVPKEQIYQGKAYPASDLYSLGATGFHLLSGVHPYKIFEKEDYNWTKEWKSKIKQPISDSLMKILDKLLQMDYNERYQSAQEVLDDLKLYDLEKNGNPPPPFTQPSITRQIFSKKQPPVIGQSLQGSIEQGTGPKPPIKLIASIVTASLLLAGVVVWEQTHQKPPDIPVIPVQKPPAEPITPKKPPIW